MTNARSKKKITKIVVISSVAVLALGAFFGGAYLVGELRRTSEGYIPTAEQLEHATKYSRVVVFGVDGAGSHFEETETPNFDRIFSTGSINYRSLVQHQADSAPNWGSMLHGVKYAKHRVHNEDSANKPYTNDKYPSIYKIAHSYYENRKSISINNWPNINNGLIEPDLDYVVKINTETDSTINQNFFDNFLTVDPLITWMVYDDVDAAGHGTGLSETYFNAIKEVDRKIGKVYDFLEANNKVNDTLFLCVADHGHKVHGGHGIGYPFENELVIRTTIAVNGKLGNIVERGKMGKAVTHDVASIILYGLGVPQPNNFDGRVPFNIFSDLR